MRLHTRSGLSLFMSLALGAVANAGPLAPPVGPVASTHKTLTEVEPRIAINATNTPGDILTLYKITQPGSYYLTGNISVPTAVTGIGILASGVTIDLNGFELIGSNSGLAKGITFINAANGLKNIVIRNGSIRNFGGDGIDLSDQTYLNCRVCDIVSASNGGAGIRTGRGSAVIRCSAASNLGSGPFDAGIAVSDGSTVNDCTANSNAGSGISAGNHCLIANCATKSNSVFGITTFAGCTLSDCTASQNGAGINGGGVQVSANCTVRNCIALQNIGNGISGGFASCTLVSCTASSNGGSGISGFGQSNITGCTATNNGADGITIGSGGTIVADCISAANALDGIRCAGNAHIIRGNNCADNGSSGSGAGIHITGSDCRVEANSCSTADRGVEVGGAGNVIFRNTCSGNTLDWSIAANNYYGPIADRRGVATAAVNGFAAGSTLGLTDAHANWSY